MSNFIEQLYSFSLEMIEIPGGNSLMGSPENEGHDDEHPQHQVTVPPFFMGKYPVTQAQWKAIASRKDLKIKRDLEPEPSGFKGDDYPVEQVSWYDAVEFCDRLSKLIGKEYRLPTEVEWEYACRAGTTTSFHFGKIITDKLANYTPTDTYDSDPKKTTISVGSFSPNAFGLYDMHGQVWEWCLDHWHKSYQGAPTDHSSWLSEDESKSRVIRGGSWYSNPNDCRSAFRGYNGPDAVNDQLGFRVVCSMPNSGKYPLGDGIGSVELIDRMGDDLSVVNAARVSYDKRSYKLIEKDKKLINYLIQHKHYSPLRGVVFTFRIKCPLFVARQWWKHVVSSSYTDSQIQWNESSFRYITLEEPEFYIPQTFRVQSKTNKQSSEESIDIDDKVARLTYETACSNSAANYKHLLELGVCREQARAVLIPAVYTSFIWTVSLQALLNFISLRTGEGAQSEIVMYAKAIRDAIHEYVPTVMEAWNKYEGSV